MPAANTAAVLALAALVLAVLALAVALRLGRRLGRQAGQAGQAVAPAQRAEELRDELRGDLTQIRAELARARDDLAVTRSELAGALRHVAVVRYDAFRELGGRLSFSAALLDDRGDGLVLSSICGRSDARTYAKGIADGESEHELSPEEREAIDHARRQVRTAYPRRAPR